jgi:signal transduction histidine kinase
MLRDRANFSEAGRLVLKDLSARAAEAARHPSDLDAMTRADREADMEAWLEKHGFEEPWEMAPALVSAGFDCAALDSVAQELSGEALTAAVAWLGAALPVYALAYEIGNGSSRISEIVGALKGYSYLGQAPVQEIDLREGLDNTLIILRSKLKQGIEVRRDYGADVPRVLAHGSELNQVWTNILDNAADALGGKGHITIRTRLRDPWAVVEIEDDGPGIPETAQPKIFDPFFTTKDPGKGTGLGLATTYSIIRNKHHGEIGFQSGPGKTIFTVKLPLERTTSEMG